MRYWLMKSEPTSYSIEHLQKEKNKTTHWDGVRNYQARNMIRDQMKVGDLAFFYHSNANPTGIAGIVNITKEAYPDATAFDLNDHHYDPKSDPSNPRWYQVDIHFVKQFTRLITLTELKQYPELSGMQLLKKGNRLSVMPIKKSEWDFIISLTDK